MSTADGWSKPNFASCVIHQTRPLGALVLYCKVMLCRACGFRVRVWESYRTSRSFGYWHGSVTELTEVPGIVARAYRTHRSSGRVQKMLYLYPGYCGTGAYRTHRRSGYGHECPTELTEVPDTGMKVLQNLQKFRVMWHGRTELTEVPGTGINVVQNSQKFFVQVWMLYRTHRSSGYG